MTTLSLLREVTVNFVNRLLLPPRESEAFKWIKPLNRRDHSLSALGSQRDGEPRWTWSDFQRFCPESKNRSFVLKLLNLIYSVLQIFNGIKLLNRRDHSLSALGSQRDGELRWTWSDFQDFCLETKNLSIYNIIRWVAWTNESSTKRLMFQVLFFSMISCKILEWV